MRGGATCMHGGCWGMGAKAAGRSSNQPTGGCAVRLHHLWLVAPRTGGITHGPVRAAHAACFCIMSNNYPAPPNPRPTSQPLHLPSCQTASQAHLAGHVSPTQPPTSRPELLDHRLKRHDAVLCAQGPWEWPWERA